MSAQASGEHLDIPWRGLLAEFGEFVFQFIDFVFKVVDVQVLRTDSILGHHRLRDRQRVGTECHDHDHNSSPHTAAAAADGGVSAETRTWSSRHKCQLSTEILC